ncbi:MAG TPA: D-alanine--D-alanine ligase family protein [Rhodothermales bacterium]|nr:D-alanine--D-alanine ligase family protein [Rhodothermales bacterium]
MHRKIRVGVVMGGRSSEHEVSLRSAQSVIQAMDKERFEVVPVGITKTGKWIIHPEALAILLTLADKHMLPADFVAAHARAEAPVSVAETASMLPTMQELAAFDVLFPVMHGPFCEDGTIQGLLEMAHIPYVGAGVLASAVGMDKIVFKDVMKANGIPVSPYWHCLRSRWKKEPESVLDEVEAALGYPVFSKPPNMGSSVGISKCSNRDSLRKGITEAVRFDRKILIEAAVPNVREIEVSVLGNDYPKASVPGEIVPNHEFYDYEAKYLGSTDNDSKLLIPAPLTDEETAYIRQLAVRTYRAIDGAGLSRVDFLMNRETCEVFINEVNTMPGFTSISMYPKMWEATGISYQALITQLIELAIERFKDREKLEF